MGKLHSSRPYRKLPAELNREIFYCLNLVTRRKFISGLGWNFYAMSRHSLHIKSKRLCNPEQNAWKSNGVVTISDDGLIASKNANGWQNTYAQKGFPITVADCRTDDFPGTVCYYYEVKTLSERFVVGLIHNGIYFGILLAEPPIRYTLATRSTNGRLGNYQFMEWPVEARLEPSNIQENICGCGILIDPDKKVNIFFTLNGILGKQLAITSSMDRLFPAVTIWENLLTHEANFGDDKAKPFQYDIRNCPGMGLDCI